MQILIWAREKAFGLVRHRQRTKIKSARILADVLVYLEIKQVTVPLFYIPTSETKNTMFPLKTLSLLLTSCNGEERERLEERRRKKRLTDEHISKMAF